MCTYHLTMCCTFVLTHAHCTWKCITLVKGTCEVHLSMHFTIVTACKCSPHLCFHTVTSKSKFGHQSHRTWRSERFKIPCSGTLKVKKAKSRALLTPCNKILSMKLIVIWWDKIFPTFYGLKISLMFSKTLQQDPILSLLNPVHIFIS